MKKIVLFSAFILFLLSGASARKRQDFWQWNTFSIDKKISSRISLNFDEELRFFENLSAINLFYSNFGVSYSFNKTFKVAATYRWLEKSRPEGLFSTRHRLYGDLFFKKRLPLLREGKCVLTFIFRTRL